MKENTAFASRPHFTLRGSRGSIPTPGGRFVRHGGNTSCLSVESGDDFFIFDAGTGIRDVGLELMAKPPRRIHLFITHTHWDHIQGFPFFIPAYVPGFEIVIYGAAGFGKPLQAVLSGQLDLDYFPVQMDAMRSTMIFETLSENTVNVGNAKVTWEYSQHPGTTVGYKIEVDGHRLAWVPDNEFLQGYTEDPTGLSIDDPSISHYRKMINFLSNVDVLIHEAQYLDSEYEKKVGWGHSSVTNACVLMKFAGVKRWIVTHHDPTHDDAFLETKLGITRERVHEIAGSVAVDHGYDGMVGTF